MQKVNETHGSSVIGTKDAITLWVRALNRREINFQELKKKNYLQ